jgi:protein TonB
LWFSSGFDGLPPEPDDPGPVFARDTLLAERHSPATEWAAGSAILDRPADEPLQATKPATPSRPPAWKAAVAVSCLLHAAAALAFLTGAIDTVQIAGSDHAGVMLLGNAPEDLSSAGDGVEATNVTLVTMLDPKPVATVNAEPVAEMDAIRPVEDSVQPVVETARPKTVEPEVERVAEAAEPISRSPVAETTESAAEAMPAGPTPEVLAALAAEPAQEALPHPQRVESLTEATGAAPATVQADHADAVAAEADVSEVQDPPVPRPKPAVKAGPAETVQAKKPVDEKPVREKPARKTGKKASKDDSADRIEKADKATKKAGSGGGNRTDSRRGVADGQADGRRQVAGKGGSASAAGNAAASNYPGKVAAKLRRAVRSISRGGRSRASNDVLISFTVNAAGGLGGVRIARGSGSPELDQAALAVVRRAAPFPPIPAETGRRNWAFTLPLGIR